MSNQHTLTFFPALAHLALHLNRKVLKPSDSRKLIHSRRPSSKKIGRMSQIAVTLEIARSSKLPSLRLACLVSLHHVQGVGVELLTLDGFGMKLSNSFAEYDHNSRSLKTSQRCLNLMTDRPSMEFCQNWPREGMIVGGRAYQLAPLARRMSGIEFGLWPTPQASDNSGGGSPRCAVAWLRGQKRPSGYPIQVHLSDLLALYRVKKSPVFWLWMMGIDAAHTKLSLQEIQSCHKSLKSLRPASRKL